MKLISFSSHPSDPCSDVGEDENLKGHTYYDFFSEFFGEKIFEDYFEGTESREKNFGKFVQKVGWAWTSKINHRCRKIVLTI